MKTPYAVQLTHVAIVMAENSSEAESIALDDAYTVTSDQETAVGWVKSVSFLEELEPHGWDPDAVPYNSDDDQTLRQIINRRGAGEK